VSKFSVIGSRPRRHGADHCYETDICFVSIIVGYNVVMLIRFLSFAIKPIGLQYNITQYITYTSVISSAIRLRVYSDFQSRLHDVAKSWLHLHNVT